MSKEIEGDLSVDRHIYGGGNLNIPGNARIKRNVKIDGWLDAKNIKSVNKGLFASDGALKEAYPEPKPGWWALVGSTIPAAVWHVDAEGNWSPTGEMSSDLNVDLTEYVTAAELANELKGYLQDVPEEYVTEDELEAKGYAKQADVDALNMELSAHKNEVSDSIGRIDNEIAEQKEDISASLALGNNALEVANNAVDLATKAQQKANETLSEVSEAKDEIATLQAKAATQDTLIEQANVTAESAGAKAQANEVTIKQLQTTVSNLASLDSTMQKWHKAHSIINLHSFIDQPTVERSVFPEYMVNVPSGLIQNGCIVMIYTLTGWEAWQLVDKEASLTSLDGYKQLGWDNAQILSDITQLQATMVSHGQAIDELAAKNDEQDASLTAQYSTLETHIRDFEEDIVGAKFNDAKGTLFERVIALEAENGTLKSQVESLQRLTDGYDIRFEEMQAQIDSLMQNNQ